jgi:gas vesicle protein
MSNNSKLLAAIIGGAAIGAVLGILFAPDKGSKTRSKIVDTARDLANSLDKKMRSEHGSNGHSDRHEEEVNEFAG